MELVKRKGMVIFLVVVLGLTIISSINTKKYDERNKELHLVIQSKEEELNKLKG